MSPFNVNISIINKFCDYFQDDFTHTQFHAFTHLIYGMLKDYKRLNFSSISKELHFDYQTMQYFALESGWSYKSLNEQRVKVIKRQRTTGFSKEGILAIDDTSLLKPYAKKTEGVSWQHATIVKGEAYCNVAVASCWVNASKHVPLELRFYKPEREFLLGKDDPDFKSKLDFAKELISEAIAKTIPFSHVVFDSWYASGDMINFIDSQGKKLVCEVKSDRGLLVEHPVSKKKVWLKSEELVKLFRKHFWHKTRMVDYNGRRLPAYAFTAWVKDSKVKLKALCIFGKWSDEDDKSAHMLITNDTAIGHQKITLLYRHRWGIEQVFEELKDSFYFDHYQVRHKERIMRYWTLCIIVWTLVYWIKQNGYLHKIITVKTTSCNEYRKSLVRLMAFSAYAALSKNNALRNDYFNDIKSQRFRKKCCYS